MRQFCRTSYVICSTQQCYDQFLILSDGRVHEHRLFPEGGTEYVCVVPALGQIVLLTLVSLGYDLDLQSTSSALESLSSSYLQYFLLDTLFFEQ